MISSKNGNTISIPSNLNSNLGRPPLSPMSIAGSDWSGITAYNSPSENSMSRNGSYAGPSTNGGDSSPPSSIGRSSDGNGLYSPSELSPGGMKRGPLTRQDSKLNDEQVVQQHAALKRLLEPYLTADKNSAKANKARDKLLRLTKIQFQELSTDVYDELQRRQGGGDRLSSATTSTTNHEPATPYLLPKAIFHPKRNQARQKLSTLPTIRFRDLATDVFYELERRYPQFVGDSVSRVGSPANSIARSGSPSSIDGRPAPLSATSNTNSRGVLGVPQQTNGPGALGRPLPKTLQSNTIIPNKSTMMEEDDDGVDDDDDEDAFGLDDRTPLTLNSNKRSLTSGSFRESTASTASSLARSAMNNEAEKKLAADKLIADYQQQVANLQQKLDQLESTTASKEDELMRLSDEQERWQDEKRRWEEEERRWKEEEQRLHQEHQEKESNASRSKDREMADFKSGLEMKLAEAQSLNTSLENEIAKLKASKFNKHSHSHSYYDGNDDDQDLKEKYEDLLNQHEQLKHDLYEQQEITGEVQREAANFLREMRGLSNDNEREQREKEKHQAEINKLQDEIKDWRSRYTKIRVQLRNLKAASVALPGVPDIATHRKDGAFSDPNGLVTDIQVTKFQIVIDELLRTARNDPKHVLTYMKLIVVATKNITKEVEGEVDPEWTKLKARVSATANNLVTAIRNHALAEGLSPVSLVDAAASHLTAAVLELVRVVKIRPSPADELDDENMIGEEDSFMLQPNSPRHPVIQQNGLSPARSSIDSIYSSSSMNSPRFSVTANHNKTPSGNWGMKREGKISTINPLGIDRAPAFGIRTNECNVEELKTFLITQTNGVIESIQKLLQELRSDQSSLPQLHRHIDDIVLVVGKVVQSTETSMSQTGNKTLRERADWIVKSLAECRTKMSKMVEEELPEDGSAQKEFNSRLAGHCFAMARETKELVRIVEDIDNENRDIPM